MQHKPLHVAIEYSVERNIFHCEGKPDEWSGSYIGNADDCKRLLDDEQCKLVMNKEINFKYGRRDCVPENLETPYITFLEIEYRIEPCKAHQSIINI